MKEYKNSNPPPAYPRPALSRPGSHWDSRIKALMAQVGMQDSMALYQAFKQFQNEMEQATCRRCNGSGIVPIGDGYSVNPCHCVTSDRPSHDKEETNE